MFGREYACYSGMTWRAARARARWLASWASVATRFSNKGFEEWGEIFGDDVMAAALIESKSGTAARVKRSGSQRRR